MELGRHHEFDIKDEVVRRLRIRADLITGEGDQRVAKSIRDLAGVMTAVPRGYSSEFAAAMVKCVVPEQMQARVLHEVDGVVAHEPIHS